MTHTLGRLATLTVATGLLATSLTGCGLLDGSSRIEEALEYLPADATGITFTDRVATAERLDLDDIETGASEDDLERWTEASKDEGYGTELARWAVVMQDAAFSEFDVEWEAVATKEDGLVRVWKLHDDTDFDAITDDLEDAGYQRSAEGDADVFEVDLSAADPTTGLIGGRYPSSLVNLAVVPDEHLIVSGDVEEGLDVVSDDKDSLADSGRFDDLLDEAPSQDDLELAALSVAPTCGGPNLTPEQQEQLYGGLGHPRSTGLFVVTDEDLKAVRHFISQEAADDDENGLVTYLESTAKQSGLDVDFDVEADGNDVVAQADFDDRRAVTQAWTRSEGPFACSAG